MSGVRTAHAARVFREPANRPGEADLWVVDVPELDVTGQARNLASAEREARELIGVWLDVPAGEVDVVMDYSGVDPEAWRLLAQARTVQAAADEMIRAAAVTRRQAARRLVRDNGLSLRDAAAVLGVTFARVQQLVKD